MTITNRDGAKCINCRSDCKYLIGFEKLFVPICKDCLIKLKKTIDTKETE